MFDAIKCKFRDVATIASLSGEAERLARGDGTPTPGSEHFVLAAIALPDNTALQAFERLGLTGESFAAAIRAQYLSSLDHLGLGAGSRPSATPASPAAVRPAPKLYTAAASGQALMQRIAERAPDRRSRPLLGADVLLAAGEERYSVAARAFGHLGIVPSQQEAAANLAIQDWAQTADRA